MDVKVESQKENKLLGRKEISAVMHFTGPTPKRADITNAVCSKLGLTLDSVAVRDVMPMFGARKLKLLIHAYQNAETLKKTEPRHILVRMGLAGKKPKQEKKKKTGSAKIAARKGAK